MITIAVKKGMRLHPAGEPDNRVERFPDPEYIGVSPARLPHLKPKLRVKEEDRVKRGSLLFIDKRNPEIAFVSPAAGVVERIDYGPRRTIRAIVIRRDAEEAQEDFGAVSSGQLAAMEREELVSRLMKGGLWPFLRSLPFRDLADPAVIPPAIVVNLNQLDPFHPLPSQYLEDRRDDFDFGLAALKRLAPRVHLVAAGGEGDLAGDLAGRVTHRLTGSYPADDPGVFVYYTRTSAEENRAWYLAGSEVILIGRFLAQGFYPVSRLVAVSGPGAQQIAATRQGVPVNHLVPGLKNSSSQVSVLAGGIWRGTRLEADGFLGLYDTALAVLPAGDQPEFLGFVRPGWRKPSHSRTFLSRLNRGPFVLDTGQHGEARACVNCGSCAAVCPVDILPQFTMKAVLAGEVEETLAHGLLDCVECGLCSYVCPSKVELSQILQQARIDYYNEDR